MKKSLLTLLAVSCMSQLVVADDGHWRTQRFDPGRPALHEPHGRGGHADRHHGWAWVPWFSAAAIGSTLYFAHQYAPPVTTIQVPPPVVITDPARVAYFCQPYQQYYPNTATCPAPWQLVTY